MTTTTAIRLQAGTWTADQKHSNATFEVEHAGVSTFRGGFKPIDAKLVVADDTLALDGAVEVASISIDDENIRPHVLSPDFFDADRNPTVTFRSIEITGDPDDLRVKGELGLAGISLPVEATGRLRGPVPGPAGGEKISLALEATIDRTAYGMDWQMELPGGGIALANDVKLIVELELDNA